MTKVVQAERKCKFSRIYILHYSTFLYANQF